MLSKVAAAAFVSLLSAAHAAAQQRTCAPLPQLEAELAQRWGETLTWSGAVVRRAGRPDFQLRLYANKGTRSWTIVAVRAADGCAEPIEAGDGSTLAAREGTF